MIHLDYRDARPIYTQIGDGIREQIRTGILCPGDKLPSVRELATTLTINPNTIQRAYRELEIQGWVASMAGKGCFICGVPSAAETEEQEMLREFDRIALRLQNMGIGAEELAARLIQGGNENA
jgi:GntR family transcriptional regulator